IPCLPALTPLTIVVHATGVSGCVVERSVPRAPRCSRAPRFGRSPASTSGSITSKVAASSPTTINFGIGTNISVGQLFRAYTPPVEMAAKVMIIGLDCAEPSLVLERWRDELPALSGLMERGRYGRLRSVVPPITVPAWSCMMASRTPGDLGVYGFRNRVDHSYDNLVVADGSAIHAPRLWDVATRYGKPSIVVGVPGTYPPGPLNGVMVSCFLTPSRESGFTYPPLLAREVEQVVGEYLFDCTDFRTNDKDDLLRQVYEMTDKRFRLAEHLLETRPWQLFAFVEMGTDRIHHGFWKYMDEQHRKHEPGGPYEHVIRDYYEHVDGLVGKLLEHADDETLVLVVSDHGAKRLEGGIRVNEWLRREGLLHLTGEPNGVTSPREVGIDWSQTVAWGEGGEVTPFGSPVRCS